MLVSLPYDFVFLSFLLVLSCEILVLFFYCFNCVFFYKRGIQLKIFSFLFFRFSGVVVVFCRLTSFFTNKKNRDLWRFMSRARTIYRLRLPFISLSFLLLFFPCNCFELWYSSNDFLLYSFSFIVWYSTTGLVFFSFHLLSHLSLWCVFL